MEVTYLENDRVLELGSEDERKEKSSSKCCQFFANFFSPSNEMDPEEYLFLENELYEPSIEVGYFYKKVNFRISTKCMQIFL